MKKAFLLSIICVCIYSSVFTQSKLKFNSQLYGGFLKGESDAALQLQTINGFSYKTWYTGIGLGLDYYFERSIPLFLSVNKFLSSKRMPLYFNADAGINFPWEKKNVYYINYRGEFSPSLYWAGGLGYKIALGNEAVLFNVGYSFKHLVQTAEYPNPCLVPPCPTYKETYDYRLRRVSVKVGWMF